MSVHDAVLQLIAMPLSIAAVLTYAVHLLDRHCRTKGDA